MSQIATARSLPRSRTQPTHRQPLRVVRQVAPAGQPGIVALCLGLLIAGLIGVLMLNTSMAKGSFELGDLQDRSNELADTTDDLQHAINAQSASSVLAQRALQRGMVPAQSAAFLRLDDGKVLGVAAAAKDDKEFSVATQGNSSAAAAQPAQPQTTVRTVGTVTTTTVTTAKGDKVEVTTTSVDSRTGATTTKTTVKAAPAPTPSARASSAPKPSASASATSRPSPSTTPTPSAR